MKNTQIAMKDYLNQIAIKKTTINITNGFLAHKEILGVHVLFLGVPIKQVS